MSKTLISYNRYVCNLYTHHEKGISIAKRYAAAAASQITLKVSFQWKSNSHNIRCNLTDIMNSLLDFRTTITIITDRNTVMGVLQ